MLKGTRDLQLSITMVDESSCLQQIRNLINTCRKSGRKSWLDICVKTEEYLQEVSVKQRLSILDIVWKWISVLVKKDDLTSDNAEEFILLLTRVWCTIYFCSLRNLKLCQKVKRVFNSLCEIRPYHAKYEIKQNISELLSTNPTVNAVETVCQLIDVSELGKECVAELFDDFLSSISHCLDSYSQQYIQQHCEEAGLLSTCDVCQTIVKAVLKTFQYFPRKVCLLISDSTATEGNTVLETVIDNLWRILFCKILPKECTFLCGTAMGLLLAIAADLEPCLFAKEIVTQLLIASGASFMKYQAMPQQHHSVMIGCFTFELPLTQYRPITQLAIVMGIIKSQKKEILLEIGNEEQATLMEGLLFQATYTLCKESKNSPVHYVAFEAMRQWLLCMKNLLKKKAYHEYSKWMTSVESYHVTHLVEIIWENLEDPIDGVPGLAVTLFSLLLELHKDEEMARNSVDKAFYTSLRDKVIGLPWHVKGRYGLICSLLSCIGLQQILEKQPTLLDDLIRCLGVNQLTSPSTSAFKAFLEHGRNEKEQTEFVKQWEKSWQDGLFRALTSKDRLLQQNACLYWLPCVLKCIPESLNSLLEKLRDAHNKEKRANKTSDGTRFLSAYLSVLKVSRSLAILQTDDLGESFLHQGLTHLQDDIRATALSVISFTPKTAEPLSLMELTLLKEFLPHNLNTACASFRQTLFVSMKKILGRVRDSSLILLKEHFKLPNQRKKDCALPATVNAMFEFVTWLFDLAVSCFFPGASYQRQKTAMQLLVAILDVFSVKWQPDKKKGQPPASCHLLVSLANQHGYLKFFSARSAALLFGCIESPFADIRDSAFYLLQEHFSWPLILLENDCTGKASASILLQKALTLARSPKVQDCESAAVLFRLIQRKYVSDLEWECNLLTVEVTPSAILGSKSSSSGKLSSIVQMLQQLLAELKIHVKAAQKDMKLASQNAPGHGISLAMAQSVEETFDAIKDTELCKLRDCWHELQTVLYDTVDTAVHIITDMMDILSGNYCNTHAIGGASFADIGVALDEILSLSMDVSDEETKEPFPVQSHREIVISCCWLNIKCACQLLAVIFKKNTTKLELISMSTLLDEEILKLVAETACKVILQCRHQGVVQNCRGSFMRICQCLFHSSQPCLHSLPSTWLNEMLNTVSSTRSVTSVTRRSAGLPVVFSTILSCEPTSGQRPLLKQCMESLLDTAASPLPTVIDQHKDLPQVHAINILKALYQDTSLGCGVLQYASQGTAMAVTGFASSSWAVRNASMQMFGSLVKRMLGQRQGTDDNSEMNTINAVDFFNSYPALQKFFLTHLQSTADSVSNSSLFSPMSRPELFPILTLLSNLHPCPEASQSCSSSLLSDFVPHLESLSSCASYAVRVVAAKALVPFIPCEHLLNKAKELVILLPGPGESFSQNILHGTLLQISAVLQAVTWSTVAMNDRGLLNEVLNKIWICSCNNSCPLTRASFLGIVMKFGPLLGKDFTRDCKPVQCIVMNSLEVSGHGADHTLPGDAQWHRTLVRACLECHHFHQSWPKDNKTKEQRSLLSILLSSTDKERRLAALEYLSKELHQIPNSIQVDLVNLLISETDHRCLVVALEMFVELCDGVDICLLSYADLKILCDKLASFARQTRGVSVAGKAIPAYSIALKFMTSFQETNSWELQAMLSQWRELIETYCQWEQDEVLRLGSVQSLQYFGVTVLWNVTTEKGDQPCFVETAISVLSSAMCLLQDEEENIRSTAAQFVALICEPASSVTCSAALQLALHFLVKHFWSIPGCWVAMETMIRGLKSTEDVLKEYSRAKQMLFEQEDSNLYFEHVIFVKMLVEHFKLIISKILPCDKNNVTDDFLEWFVTACQRLENDVRSLSESAYHRFVWCETATRVLKMLPEACSLHFQDLGHGFRYTDFQPANNIHSSVHVKLSNAPGVNIISVLKDYGSLSNPKPFTVRFRVMCMAQVLWSAINNGLRNDCCLKEISALKELLVNMLEQIIQVNNPLHPWLTEYASDLISIVHEQEAK